MNNNQLLTNLKAVKNDVRSKLQQYSNFENAYLLDFAKGKQLKRKISSKASKMLNVDKQIANITAKCETNKAQLQADQETIKQNIASIEENKRQITLQIQQTKTEISGIRAEIDKKKANSKELQRQIDMLNNDPPNPPNPPPPPNPPNPPNNQSGNRMRAVVKAAQAQKELQNKMKINKPTPSFKNQGEKVQKMVGSIEAMKPPQPKLPIQQLRDPGEKVQKIVSAMNAVKPAPSTGSFKNQGKKMQKMVGTVKSMTPRPPSKVNSRSYRNVVAGTPAITKLTSQLNRVTNVRVTPQKTPNYKTPMNKIVAASPRKGPSKVVQMLKRPFQRKGSGSGGGGRNAVLYNQKRKKSATPAMSARKSWGNAGVGF